MKSLQVSISIFFLIFYVVASTHANPAEKERRTYQVKDFHSVELNGSYEVILSQGDKKEVMIEADQRVHDEIEVKVKRGVLIFDLNVKQAILKKTKIYISNPDFEVIHIKGAGNLWSTTGIRSNNLGLLASGAAEVDLDVNVKNLDAAIHGAGNIRLRGKADESYMNIDGAGGIKAYSLTVEELEVVLNGAGNAQVHAEKDLDVEIKGIGRVTYEGNPKLRKDIAGLGKLKRR